MDNSLLAQVGRFVTPEMATRLAASLGLDQTAFGRLLSGALPALLASFGAVASKPEGAARIAESVASQDPDMLGRLAGAIGGAGQHRALAQGASTLSGLLGGDVAASLTRALGAHAGADQQAASSVLGLLAPATLGVIGQQDPANWMDAGGVSKFFASESKSIAAAMPAGLGQALGAAGLSGLLSSGLGGASAAVSEVRGAAASAAAGVTQGVANAAGSASAAVRRTAADAADAAYSAQRTARDVGGSVQRGVPTWIWIVAAVLAAALGWYLLSGRSDVRSAADQATQTAGKAAQSAAGAAGQAAQTAQSAAGAAVSQASSALGEVAKQASDALTGLASPLASITDAASANAALPKLREAVAGVDKLAERVNALPAESRKAVAGPLAAALPALRQVIDRALALPGVGEIIRPIVEPALAKLDALAKA